MLNRPSDAPILIVTGPTAVGKTAVCVELARHLQTDIISADSMQVYKHLAIGTAKPKTEELGGVTCRLIDYVEPDQQYTVGTFVRDADRAIEELSHQGKLPIICGGTGMYLKSLLYGLSEEIPMDASVRERLKEEMLARGLPALYDEMLRVDPGSRHVTPADKQRILRVLEVYRISGKPMSGFHAQSLDHPRYRARVVVLERLRQKLNERINLRVDQMLADGLLDEIRAYLRQGYSRENPAIKALGYADMIRYLENSISLDEAVELMKRRTRQFAKRQMTWFRSMRNAESVDLEEVTISSVVNRILKDLS